MKKKRVLFLMLLVFMSCSLILSSCSFLDFNPSGTNPPSGTTPPASDETDPPSGTTPPAGDETDPPSGTTPPSGDEGELPSNSTANNCIYCDPIEASAGQEISVPVSIKNNKGICGFEIIITYDANVVTPKSVTPSSSISTGNFNDSIDTMQDNSFSVVWSGSSNITTDSELFVITFDINDGANEDVVIQVSYNQENTINEDIDEIDLNCYDITINLQSED